MFIRNRYLIIYFLSFLFCINSYPQSQTSAYGNYSVYTPKSKYYGIGYYNTKLTLPYLSDTAKGGEYNQSGFIFSFNGNWSEIASVPLSLQSNFKFNTNYDLSIGCTFSVSDDSLRYTTLSASWNILGVSAEYCYAFSEGSAINFKLGLGLINLGGSVSFLNSGNFQDNGISRISIIPIRLKPSIYYDFGRNGLGVEFVINSIDMISYIIGPDKYFKAKNKNFAGFRSGDTTIKSFSANLIFVF